MKLSKTKGIINESKLKNDVKLFNQAKNILEKLNSSNRTELINLFVNKGVLSLEIPFFIWEDKLVYVWDENTGSFSDDFAYFVWKEVILNGWMKKEYDFDFHSYDCIDKLSKIKLR